MASDGSISRWLSRYWLLVPVVLAAILIRNWVEQPETLMPPAPLAISESQADYLLQNFTTRHYDVDGELAYSLTGETLAHYPDGDRAEILRPEIVLKREQSTWSVTAESGELTRLPDIVNLLGDVHINRTVDDDASPPLTIESSNVFIAMEDDTIRTDEPVRLESPGLVIEANGLQSSIKQGKLELLSGVNARYEVAPGPAALIEQ